jgi:hypothetical protein
MNQRSEQEVNKKWKENEQGCKSAASQSEQRKIGLIKHEESDTTQVGDLSRRAGKHLCGLQERR